jgi:hypothetical protein
VLDYWRLNLAGTSERGMIAHYQERAAGAARKRDEETRLSVLISRLRLAAFLPGAAALVWASPVAARPWLLLTGCAHGRIRRAGGLARSGRRAASPGTTRC